METYPLLLFVIQPVDLFWLTYSATLILGTICLAWLGYRNKYPLGAWVAITASVLVLFVIGIKIFIYSPAEWGSILTGTHHNLKYIKYVPGGLLLVAICIPLIKHFLGFRASVFDGFVLFLPLLGVFQRVGCFFNGCCYGTHTQLPWAVHYSWPSNLFFEHYDQEVLPFGQMHSLGVHPTQLYTIILSLAITIILWYNRRRFKAPGNLTLFAMILLGFQRFLLEFFRQPRPETWSNIHWLSVNLLQWGIIILALVFVVLIWKREKDAQEEKPPVMQDQPLRSAVVLFILVFLVWQVREIFDGIELMIIYPVLIFSLIVLAVKVFHEVTTPVSRTILVSMMMMAFLAMGHTLVDGGLDSLARQNYGWFSIGTAGGVGAYQIVSRDCDGNITSRYRRDFSVLGVSAAYHYMPRSDRHFQAGLKHFYINDYIDREFYTDEHYVHFMPFLRYDAAKFAAGAGFIFGFPRLKSGYNEYSPSRFYFPSIYLRAGQRNKFFGEIDLGHPISQAGQVGYFQTGLGFGLPEIDNFVVRFGLAVGKGEGYGFYIGSDMLLFDRLSITPNFTMKTYPTFSMGLQYHMGNNRWKPLKIK
jgi:hypothetical protein